jgi:hypothetical protein
LTDHARCRRDADLESRSWSGTNGLGPTQDGSTNRGERRDAFARRDREAVPTRPEGIGRPATAERGASSDAVGITTLDLRQGRAAIAEGHHAGSRTIRT